MDGIINGDFLKLKLKEIITFKFTEIGGISAQLLILTKEGNTLKIGNPLKYDLETTEKIKGRAMITTIGPTIEITSINHCKPIYTIYYHHGCMGIEIDTDGFLERRKYDLNNNKIERKRICYENDCPF